MPEYRTDEPSVGNALAALIKSLEGVALADIEKINDATWRAAAQFDVDQTTLESALAESSWPRNWPVGDVVSTKCPYCGHASEQETSVVIE